MFVGKNKLHMLSIAPTKHIPIKKKSKKLYLFSKSNFVTTTLPIEIKIIVIKK